MSVKAADMNVLERWRSRPLQVRFLIRCDECVELKDDVQKRVNYWSNIRAPIARQLT